MSECTEKRWRCDFCNRDIRRGVMPPAKWLEANDSYGNAVHCCDRDGCQTEMREFCEKECIDAPA